MKYITLFILLFFLKFSYSQDIKIEEITENNKLVPSKIKTNIVGILPYYITNNSDHNYSKNSNEENIIIQKLDSIINQVITNELKVDFIKYENIDTELIRKKIGWLTGALEHNQFNSKTGYPKDIVNTNENRYQIGISVNTYPIYKTKRNFYYLFIFDTKKNKTIGYEQIITDYALVNNYKLTSKIISLLIQNLNNQIFIQ